MGVCALLLAANITRLSTGVAMRQKAGRRTVLVRWIGNDAHVLVISPDLGRSTSNYRDARSQKRRPEMRVPSYLASMLLASRISVVRG
jgi:hypothetical protein